MAKLTIDGDKRQLEVIERENRIRASRHALKFSYSEEAPKIEPKSEKSEPLKQQVKSGSGKATGKK